MSVGAACATNGDNSITSPSANQPANEKLGLASLVVQGLVGRGRGSRRFVGLACGPGSRRPGGPRAAIRPRAKVTERYADMRSSFVAAVRLLLVSSLSRFLTHGRRRVANLIPPPRLLGSSVAYGMVQI